MILPTVEQGGRVQILILEVQFCQWLAFNASGVGIKDVVIGTLLLSTTNSHDVISCS